MEAGLAESQKNYWRKMEYCFAEISLSNYAHNLTEIRQVLPQSTKILAVIKANAYGHGIVEIAKKAESCGVYALGVARINEALIVRAALPKARIVILGYTPECFISEAVANDIDICVFHQSIAKAISQEAKRQNKIARIHIKLDTGMGRIGYLCGNPNSDESIKEAESALDEIATISQLPHIKIAGIFTHFSSADEGDFTLDSSYTKRQYELYCDFTKKLQSLGVCGFFRHCANSSAMINYPFSAMDIVRLGIATFGVGRFENLALKPVMSFKARVIHIKTLPKNFSISYGRTFTTNKTSRIATLCVGYADGYNRALSNKAEVLISGKRAKIVGNICMDQLCVDISEIDGVKIGDEATLFGSDGYGNEISVDELADKIGTISYEILCAVGIRVARIYKD